MTNRSALVLVLAFTLPIAAAPTHKTYIDPATGVTFTYPASWLLNGDDDAATAKFRITDRAQPSAVVQLEGNFAEGGPYKGTDFESGAFAYVVSQDTTPQTCFALIDRSAEGTQIPVSTIWSGLAARRLDVTYTTAGTEDIHRILAVFRNNRCYLFETSIIATNKQAVARPLDSGRWRQIHAAFATVLQSVHFTPLRAK